MAISVPKHLKHKGSSVYFCLGPYKTKAFMSIWEPSIPTSASDRYCCQKCQKRDKQPWHYNITGRNYLHVSHFSVWLKGAMYYIAHIFHRNRCNYVLGTCLQFSLRRDAGWKTTRDVCTQYTPASFVAEYTVVNQPQWSEFYSSQWPNNNRVCDMWGKAALIHHAYWKTEQYIKIFWIWMSLKANLRQYKIFYKSV